MFFVLLGVVSSSYAGQRLLDTRMLDVWALNSTSISLTLYVDTNAQPVRLVIVSS